MKPVVEMTEEELAAEREQLEAECAVLNERRSALAWEQELRKGKTLGDLVGESVGSRMGTQVKCSFQILFTPATREVGRRLRAFADHEEAVEVEGVLWGLTYEEPYFCLSPFDTIDELKMRASLRKLIGEQTHNFESEVALAYLKLIPERKAH